MNYPVWDVPFLGNGWVIGLTAILHVFISHFAIGGGAFLAFTEQLAYNKKDDALYAWLKTHMRFFLLVTTVLGTVTGVGIWWSIGLANPGGASTLLQVFSPMWAIEWIFFAAELATFFVYYYTYDKMPRKQHLVVAWAYFAVSIFTLIVINGILTFMLTSGKWPQTHYWLDGWLNPGFGPAFLLRVFIMFALAGIYALLTATRIKGNDNLRAYLIKYSAKWMIPGLMFGPIAAVWYLFELPPATQTVLLNGITTMGIGNFSIMARVLLLTGATSVVILLASIVGPFLNPRHFSFTFAVFLMVAAFTFMFGEEWSREMMRKPYVVYNFLYSNGMLKESVEKVSAAGYFNSAPWAQAELASLPSPTDKDRGRLIFKYQCMSCHTQKGGSYRSMENMLGQRDENAISNLLTVLRTAHIENKDNPNPYHGIMPPFVGSADEQKALTSYLVTLVKKETEGGPAVASAEAEPAKRLAQGNP